MSVTLTVLFVDKASLDGLFLPTSPAGRPPTPHRRARRHGQLPGTIYEVLDGDSSQPMHFRGNSGPAPSGRRNTRSTRNIRRGW